MLTAWIYFRSEYVYQAEALIRNGLSGHWDWETGKKLEAGLAFTLPVVAMHVRGLLAEKKWLNSSQPMEKVAWCAFMIYGVISLSGQNNAFIYFHF